MIPLNLSRMKIHLHLRMACALMLGAGVVGCDRGATPPQTAADSPKAARSSPDIATPVLNDLRSIPSRPKDAPAQLIDLSKHYNAALRGTWHPVTDMSGTLPNDLGGLPMGIQRLNDTPFDVRGLIQLVHKGSESWDARFPAAVTNIMVGQKCRRIHFLHGAGFVSADGTAIGVYEIQDAAGAIQEMPIVYGSDVRDWWAYKFDAPTADRSKVAWTGTNAAAAKNGISIRLYKTTWINPNPDVPVDRIHFRSRRAESAPFLVAITAEP